VSNLTNAQPLSPIAVIGHGEGYRTFAVGSAASVGLEELAEGGDNAALLAEAAANTATVVTATGAGPIAPAGSETLAIELLESELADFRISVSTMLVNTNDAFTGLDSISVGSLAVGDSLELHAIAYDAGTEADTELTTDIPGPAANGEGFNAMRSDLANRVSMHPGIVSLDDGLTISVLTNQHRFDNPVAGIRIERID
jgi:hypothetical protein